MKNLKQAFNSLDKLNKEAEQNFIQFSNAYGERGNKVLEAFCDIDVLDLLEHAHMDDYVEEARAFMDSKKIDLKERIKDSFMDGDKEELTDESVEKLAGLLSEFGQ